MNSLRTDSHGHAPIEIFKHSGVAQGHSNAVVNLHPMHGQHASEAHILAQGGQVVPKKSSSLKSAMIQRSTGLQKRTFGDDLTKQISQQAHHQVGSSAMQGGANQYVLYPISSNGNSNHQGSEQTRASSGHAVSSSMNKSFDFVNNPKQLNSLKVKHLAKRNSSGHNVENHNPNSVLHSKHQQALHDKSSSTEAVKYQHIVSSMHPQQSQQHHLHAVENNRGVEAPKILGNNSNPHAQAASPFTSGTHTMHPQQRLSGGGHEKLRPLLEQQSRFAPGNSRDSSAGDHVKAIGGVVIQKRSSNQVVAGSQFSSRVNTYHSQHNQMMNNSQRLTAIANNAAFGGAQRVSSVGAVAPSSKASQAHAYDRGGSHTSQPVQTAAQSAASNAIKSMNIQKRKALEHPKLMNRTVMEESNPFNVVKEAANRHNSMIDCAMESRRDSSHGAAGSLPSSRNFKQNQVLKKVIESSRMQGQGSNSQPRGEIHKSHQTVVVDNLSVHQAACISQTKRATDIQLSASTAKHTSKAVKLSDSQTASVGKFTDKDQLQSSIKRHAETPNRVKILRFHNNLKKGGLFQQRVDLEDRETYFDPQCVAEHSNHIYHHCLATEGQTQPAINYMDFQKDINPSMREILNDWLIEVHLKFKLHPETLFLTINLIDRYLSTTSIYRNKLQLVGVAAMFIASKYEDIYPPTVTDYVYITDNAYTREEIFAMEKRILIALQFSIHFTSSYRFLERFLYLKKSSETEKNFALFMLEGSLIQYPMLAYKPSELAASSLYLASKLCFSKEPWSNRMASITTLQEKTLRKCSKDIYTEVLLKNINESNKLRAVFNKFSTSKYGSVSTKIQQRTQQKESLVTTSVSTRTKASTTASQQQQERDSTASKGQKRHHSMTNPSVKSQALASGKQASTNSFGPHKQMSKPIQIVPSESVSTALDSSKQRQMGSSSVPSSHYDGKQMGSFDGRSVKSPKPGTVTSFIQAGKPPTVLGHSSREQTQTLGAQSSSLQQLFLSKATHQAHPPSQKKQQSVRSVSSHKGGKESGVDAQRYQKFNQCLQRSKVIPPNREPASSGCSNQNSATRHSQEHIGRSSLQQPPSARGASGHSQSSMLKAAIRGASIPGKPGFSFEPQIK